MTVSVASIPDIDPECIALCDALNSYNGVTTTSSCCGHGKSPFQVFLHVESLKELADLSYEIDGCHSGVYGWSMEVWTDCGAALSFILTGPAESANELAAAICPPIQPIEDGVHDAGQDSGEVD